MLLPIVISCSKETIVCRGMCTINCRVGAACQLSTVWLGRSPPESRALCFSPPLPGLLISARKEERVEREGNRYSGPVFPRRASVRQHCRGAAVHDSWLSTVDGPAIGWVHRHTHHSNNTVLYVSPIRFYSASKLLLVIERRSAISVVWTCIKHARSILEALAHYHCQFFVLCACCGSILVVGCVVSVSW